MLGKLGCIVVYMFLWFNIQLSAFPENSGKILYHILPFFILLVFYKQTISLLKNIKRYKYIIGTAMFLYTTSIIWGVVIVNLFNGEYSCIVYTLNMFSAMIRFVAMAVLASVAFPKKNAFISFLQMCVICNVLYVLASVFFLLTPDAKFAWSQMINLPDSVEKKGDIIQESTRYGLAGYSGFNNTIMSTTAVWMCLMIMELKSINILWNCGLLILLTGNMMYGRSGVILSIGLILVFYLHKMTFAKMKSMLSIIMGGMIIITSAVSYAKEEPILNRWTSWIMEPVIAFSDGLAKGEISFGESGNTLTDRMYFLPDDDSTICVGDGRFSNSDGSYYMHTDAGFMRHMLFYGVIGCFLLYSMLFLLLYMMYKVFKNNGLFIARRYVALIAICIFFMEFKGVTLNFFCGLVMGGVSACLLGAKKERIING